MNEDLLLDLINRDIDDMLNAAEKQELSAELQRNPEARKLHSQLLAMNNSLGAVEDVDPPADFTKSVMRALPPDLVYARSQSRANRQSADGRSTSTSLIHQIRSFFAAPWRPALAGAAVLAILIAVFAPSGEAPHNDQSIGTLGLGEHKVVDSGVMDDLLTAKLLIHDRDIIIRIEMLEAANANIQVDYDSRIVTAQNVTEIGQTDDGMLELNLDGGTTTNLEFELHTNDVAKFSLYGLADGQEIGLELSNR